MDFTFGVAVATVIALLVLVPKIRSQAEYIREMEDELYERDEQDAMDEKFMEASQRYKRVSP